ncbi:M24 family metallopeptidase [Fimbriiglobus ruber]|uniref:Aminopeptidase YpdF (MP-, MA-, MS-, AP-, NP-specific) n=1 Tax=Fimbriiglobus ruber TaxID=1908690 RepID=A0A225D4V7_9BACT|nr:M24 family metallopeptidase [Fimbriiglobus ruber]OWK36610.1 Aminopeptidase YpdF (MP-, MA-, MS-, AP-, NP- specific) [Fimbriiglobus ruber]
MFDLASVQAAIRDQGLDGWLLYDFRGLNVLAARVAGTTDGHRSRRWAYFIPKTGAPKKLVHRIESAGLDHLPGGDKTVYLKWQEFEAGIGHLLAGAKRVAMEYSPRNGNPYISRVDAGTVELVRDLGAEVVSSGDLIQLFEATWDDAQWASHQEAAKHTDAAYGVAWAFIGDEIRKHGFVTETAVQARIMKHFADHGLTTDHPPIVGEGPHSGDPHYAPSAATDSRIVPGSFVLIDLWAKMDKPRAVYSDLTRVGFVGDQVPAKINEVFHVVIAARDAAIDRVKRAFAAGEPLQGWQVDAACREVIEKAGYGAYFVHRTGHNIGQETHGNGCHMDGLETREERRVMRRTCFSIEPGIYLPEFGVRSEINIYVDKDGGVHVTGGALQTEIRRVLV